MLIQIPLVATRRLSFGVLQTMLGIDNLMLTVYPQPDNCPETNFGTASDSNFGTTSETNFGTTSETNFGTTSETNFGTTSEPVAGAIFETWAFYRREQSVTQFLLQSTDEGYLLSMDALASYDDYRFLPYLLDTLSLCLTDTPYEHDGQTAYQQYDEDWAAETLGEAIAYLKCYLQLGLKYYLSLPIPETNVYVDASVLRSVGVSVYSATPRIFGYIHYLLRRNRLPSDDVAETPDIDEEILVDVPQHQSIGTVRSWQTDGAETTESYSREDVDLLLERAADYRQGHPCDGVVLNDIATLYEHGIGVMADAEAAVYWYREAIRQGDRTYAPTSLGDLYRKGAGTVEKDLHKAVEAYRLSIDPYAWYRLGQSYEEGWTGAPDLDEAMAYYHRAANVYHHLALKRLGKS